MNFEQITHHHKAISPSTNSELIDAIKSQTLPHSLPHLLTADSQTAGRGQHNRSWVSPVGNVYFSLYVPMQSAYKEGLHRLTGALSLCVGLSLWRMPVIQSLNTHRHTKGLPPILVKWANDLGLYDDEQTLFCKLAGILIEPVLCPKLVGVVVGVGLNVKDAPMIFDGLYQATSLAKLAEPVDMPVPSSHTLFMPMTAAIFDAVSTHNRYTQNQPYGVCFDKAFVDDFNHAHALNGQMVGIFEQDSLGTPAQTGICTGIDSDGTLLLKQDGQTQKAFAGMAKRLKQ